MLLVSDGISCNLIWIIGSEAYTAFGMYLMLIKFHKYHSSLVFSLSQLPHTQFFLSPEEKMTMSRTTHERERLRPAEPDHYTHEHRSTASRSRVGALSRATNDRTIESPPPMNVSRRNMYSGR